MLRVLALLRHGKASGQGADATLTAEGRDELRRLGARLGAEGWAPAAVTTSPYRRARESAHVLAGMLTPAVETHVLAELKPGEEPEDALRAILEAAPLATPVLVVTHLPLVGRLAHELLGEEIAFFPGTLVEIVRDGDGSARLLRRLNAHELPPA
jgi:phosphohistidine phosphatase